MSNKDQEIQISENLIEVGDDAWQIRNLTSISRREEKVPITDPMPIFRETEPKTTWHPKRFLSAAAIGFASALFLNKSFPIAIGIAIGIWLLVDKKTDEKKAWAKRKSNYERELAAWQKLVDNPPIVYSLSIETNSGSRPVFYSFDKEGIGTIVKAVKEAMAKPGSVNATYNITTLGETNITQLGSEILQQTIAEVRT